MVTDHRHGVVWISHLRLPVVLRAPFLTIHKQFQDPGNSDTGGRSNLGRTTWCGTVETCGGKTSRTRTNGLCGLSKHLHLDRGYDRTSGRSMSTCAAGTRGTDPRVPPRLLLELHTLTYTLFVNKGLGIEGIWLDSATGLTSCHHQRQTVCSKD